jgi:hypothetical protein
MCVEHFCEGAVMMGKQTSGQERLFYGFNLESHVPQDHLLRNRPGNPVLLAPQ